MPTCNTDKEMQLVELVELRRLFDAGALGSAMVVQLLEIEGSAGFYLQFESKNKKFIYLFRGQRDKGGRVFKTADAALSNAKRVGFKRVSVWLD